MIIDYDVAVDCKNLKAWHTCHKCGECGRKFKNGFMVDDGGQRRMNEMKMTRAEILKQTEQIVCTDREETYGEPENNFSLIAALWSTYISKEISPEDVAMMMALLKIARIKTGKHKADNYIDLCGYAACAGELGAIYDRI